MAIYVVLLVSAIIILIFAVALKVKINIDSEKTELYMTMFWLQPLFKAVVTLEDRKPFLTVTILNKKLFSKTININKKRKPSSLQLIKIVEPKDIHIKTGYGFSDPYITGIACGAVNIASQFINIDEFTQIPDFTAEKDYIYVNASAEINIGSALVNFLKSKKTLNP